MSQLAVPSPKEVKAGNSKTFDPQSIATHLDDMGDSASREKFIMGLCQKIKQ